MIECDVIIIGAGPAGLFTGISINNTSKRVIILEKNSSAGKKLLISGAGQCNITHEGEINEFLNKYGDNGRFLRNALYSFTNKDLIHFFNSMGLKLISNEKGKIFPSTFKAFDVLDILLKENKKRNIRINYNEEVEYLDYNISNNIFTVNTVKNKYKSKYLVIATGGKSYPKTGSTGEGHLYAKKLGHSIVNTLPALTPVYVENYKFKKLSGISVDNAIITLWRNNKKIKQTSGPLLFTHVNISGPSILDFSRYILPKDTVKINFLGEKEVDKFRKIFVNKLQASGSKQLKSIIRELHIPNRLSDKLLEINHISGDIKCSQVNKEQRKHILNSLLEYTFNVEKLGDYHIAMATRGGVELKEIQSKSMESKLIKGLYFVGEVLNIDGDTGGYNIQAAFSTGYIAGKSIRKNMEL